MAVVVLVALEDQVLGPLVDETGTPPGDVEPISRYTGADGPPSAWNLHPWAPAATNAAYRDQPHFIVWHFELDS